MRGGRGSRGRGGRGRGEEARAQGMTTRSGKEKPEFRVQLGEMEEDDSSQQEPRTVNSNEIDEIGHGSTEEDETNLLRSPGTKPCTEKGDSEIRQMATADALNLQEELKIIKKKLVELSQNIGSGSQLPNQSAPAHQETTISKQKQCEEEEFPPLTDGSISTNKITLNVQMPSWRDKVTTPTPPIGMHLKFVPPIVENGVQVVQIEAHDVVDLIKLWDCAVVVYVVGGIGSIDIIRGFIRKHWSCVSMPTIHQHEDGYFILRFKNEEECTEILKGGPYFINRAPIIVKKWNRDFDFKDEILRVIPVWVRLPNLPLHCWGEEALSRIVSAIGVPILADECTTKQLKVSYARVLVEVDVTQDFVKDIKVRDNTGREFWQKAIPEWKPFYCRKCHKLGHECNEIVDKKKEGEKVTVGKKIWIPSNLAKVMQGVTNMEDLRAIIARENEQEEEKQGVDNQLAYDDDTGQQLMNNSDPTMQQPYDNSRLPRLTESTNGQSHGTEVLNHISSVAGEEREESWTTVTNKKSARKISKNQNEQQRDSHTEQQVNHLEENTLENRDGSPRTPSQQ
ncbi:unnamed protein product [Amaranthus hypochondriacus]